MIDQVRKAGLYDEIWRAGAVLLPVNTNDSRIGFQGLGGNTVGMTEWE
jgi:hypothetical protein